MSLAALQEEFMGHVLEDERPLPPRWRGRMRTGLEVYRNAYRTRLVDALHGTFTQTAKLVGEESFHAAAAHYLISEPPTGWTLDLVGEGFVEILEALFVNDPDVADLAWLEWAMHIAFTARDAQPIGLEEFAGATATMTTREWPPLRLQFLPSLRVRQVSTDCGSLWRALSNDEFPETTPLEILPSACVVWRDEHGPAFRLMSGLEGSCLVKMRSGSPFEEICLELMGTGDEDWAAREAGAMLRRWVELGLIASVAGGGPGP